MLSLILPMSAFALVASISPGPVNMVCLSNGIRRAIPQGLLFVSGATLGFVALFLLIGFGLNNVLRQLPGFERTLNAAAILFLLFISYRLLRDDGQIGTSMYQNAPGFISGALMQWLNPKAWLASVAGVGAYTQGGDSALIWLFAALYTPICWLSLGCWLHAGASLGHLIQRPATLRAINRVLATLLAASCLLLLLD